MAKDTRVIALLALTFSIFCMACPNDERDPNLGRYCETNDDCEGLTCTHTNECVSPDDIVSVKLSWTVDGQEVSPANSSPCIRIDYLAVEFKSQRGEDLAYSPVPCNLGKVTYNRLPSEFYRVSLIAFDAVGQILDTESRTIYLGENEVNIDLKP